MKNRWLALGISFLVLLLNYTNCGQMFFTSSGSANLAADGGIAGNPLTPKNLAQQVGLALCSKISSCAPTVGVNACYSSLQPLASLVPALGASQAVYATFGALVNANSSGAISGNMGAATSTVAAIAAESCSSTAVQSALSGNYAAMIPPLSTAIFSSVTIYRSIGSGNTVPLANGTGSITISGSNATFSSALPNNVGVGDAIVYDCSGDGVLGAGDCIAFISSRTSSSAFSVQDSSGSTPKSYGPAAVWRVYRAYTSIANALDGSLGGTENASIKAINASVGNFDSWSGGTNIVASNQQWNFAVYADGTDTSGTCMTGWTTDAAHFVRIYAPMLASEVGVTQRHVGVWDASKLVVDTSANSNIPFGTNVDYTQVEGLEILSQNIAIAVNAPSCFATALGNNVVVKENLVQIGPANGYERGALQFRGSAPLNIYVYNNIFFGNSTLSYGIENTSTTNITAYLYNNTIYGLGLGITNAGTGSLIAKNNLIANTVGENFLGGFVSSDYNNSSDNTSAGGPHDKTGQVVTFVNAASYDYRISLADTSAKGAGADLSADSYLPFNVDIAGINRTGPWDIGASTTH